MDVYCVSWFLLYISLFFCIGVIWGISNKNIAITISMFKQIDDWLRINVKWMIANSVSGSYLSFFFCEELFFKRSEEIDDQCWKSWLSDHKILGFEKLPENLNHVTPPSPHESMINFISFIHHFISSKITKVNLTVVWNASNQFTLVSVKNSFHGVISRTPPTPRDGTDELMLRILTHTTK